MIILITGITSGFGEAMARRLTADGHKVYGTHRHATDFIPGVEYIRADSTVQEDVDAVIEKVVKAEGGIDVFINNAGMGIGGPLEFCSIEDCQRQMDVNFMGMVRYVRGVIPVMRAQGGGKIICFSSIGGLMGLPFQGMYSASKFAIEGYCQALRLETARFGIQVSLIEPGDFATGFTASRSSVRDPEAYRIYEAYSASLANIEKDENGGLKPDYLADKISKIVLSRKPACHYIISNLEQRMSVFLKTILPAKWFDAILRSYYKC